MVLDIGIYIFKIKKKKFNGQLKNDLHPLNPWYIFEGKNKRT